MGLNFSKASRCVKAAKGILLTVGPIASSGDNTTRVHVEISDQTLEPGTHFATLLSRGVYTVSKRGDRQWAVVSYQADDLR